MYVYLKVQFFFIFKSITKYQCLLIMRKSILKLIRLAINIRLVNEFFYLRNGDLTIGL